MNTPFPKPMRPSDIKGRVLLVDDDRTIILTMKKQIAMAGYEVFTANSGLRALQILHDERIDILLSDICMPEMSGIELVEQAIQYQPDIQCVFITAFGDVDTAVEALKLGAYNYLLKPVSNEDLQLVLQRGMERLDLRREIEGKNQELLTANQQLQKEILEHKQAVNYLYRQLNKRKRRANSDTFDCKVLESSDKNSSDDIAKELNEELKDLGFDDARNMDLDFSEEIP